MLALYIHIPFCRHKCFYCFFAVAVAQLHHADRYLKCLMQEALLYRGAKLKTIYIGGGTPSLLKRDQLCRLMYIVRSVFDCSAVDEMTIEVNPEDMSRHKARLLMRAGITRISLGVQTFDAHFLKILGRCHTSSQIYRAFSKLRQAGFNNISADMIFALPGQTQSHLKTDLRKIIRLEPEHISFYCLSIEPASRFYVAGIQSAREDRQARQYNYLCATLEQRGFNQYEISNFARPGKQSRHNCLYWQGENYIGLGLSAHSHHDGRRKWNVSRLREYMTRLENGSDPTEDYEVLSPARRLREALVYGLRMNAGVDLDQLQQRYGVSLSPDLKTRIHDFIRLGFLEPVDNHLRATPPGRLLLDELAVYLI